MTVQVSRQKMLQLWKFVLLCGVLTGTSESLLDNLGSDLSNVVNELKPILHDGLETVDNTLKGKSTRVTKSVT